MIKILNIIHKSYDKESKRKAQEEYLKKYFSKEYGVTDDFNIDTIDFDFTDLSVDFEVGVRAFGINKNGRKAWGANDIKRHIRQLVKPNEYDIVIFWYKPNKYKAYKQGFKFRDYFSPLTNKTPLYEGTGFIQMNTDNTDKIVLVHEFSHAYKFLLENRPKIDFMDLTPVKQRNGSIKWIPYYKNNMPTVIGGNHYLTWRMYSNYHLKGLGNHVQKVIKKKKKYKYFSEKEVYGLKPELVDKLDRARAESGIPYHINSGYRSPAHNKAVGGVPNSEHTHGEAVDIRARNSREIFLILRGLYKVGFNRIGISWKKKFVHAGISKTKPQDVAWTYK